MEIANKFIVLFGVLFIAAGVAFAQQGSQPPSPPSANDIISRMKEELNLTDEQVTQITPIIQDELGQIQAFREQGVSPDMAKIKMDELRQSMELKFAQYLTQDQLTQWKNKQSPKQDANNRMGPPQEGNNLESDRHDQPGVTN